MRSKTQLFILLSFFFIGKLYTQSLHKAYQLDYYSYGSMILPLEDGSWLIGGQSGTFMGYPAFSPRLMLVDSLGQIVWEQILINDVPGIELGEVSDLFYDSLEQAIYVTTEVHGCDYGLPAVLHKLNMNGDFIWTSDEYNSTTILPSLDNTLLTSGKYFNPRLYKIDSDGEQIWELEFEHTIRGLANLDRESAHFFALIYEKLYKLDEDGTVLDSLDVAMSTSSKLQAWPQQNCLLLLNETGLYKIDTSLHILDSNSSITSNGFNAVTTDEDQIYLLSRNEGSGTAIVKMNTSLMETGQISLEADHLIGRELAIRGQTIAVTGNELQQSYIQDFPLDIGTGIYNSNGSHLFIKTMNLSGPNESMMPDIGLFDVVVNGEPSAEALDYCLVSSGQGYHVVLPDVRVRVRNYGDQTVQRLNLNAFFPVCSWICQTYSTHLRTFEVNLDPGETQVLSFGDIEVWGTSVDPYLELCIHTSVPNWEMDANYENNAHCTSILISDTEAPHFSSGLQLFPIPASDLLEIQMDEAATQQGTLRVFDQLGRQLKQVNWQQGSKQLTIPVEDLPTGM